MSVAKQKSGSCMFHGGPNPHCSVSKASPGCWGRRELWGPALGSASGRGKVEVLCWEEGVVAAVWFRTRGSAVQEHCHFDMQVGRPQGGWAAVCCQVGTCRFCLRTSQAPETSRGLSGCGLLWLCWKAPGLRGKLEL